MKKLTTLIIVFISLTVFSQKDVTQFLDIPIDGYKPEMIEKLKSKGYTSNAYQKDLLEGEFNGSDVEITVQTNNNKVWRIAISDANYTDEINIRIIFNNLIQQFAKSKRYITTPSSTIENYTIQKNENISYEIRIKNKRYQAIFFQKTSKYKSLVAEKELLLAKKSPSSEESERLNDLSKEISKEKINCKNKAVWFMVEEDLGKYYINMFYENEINAANGEDL